MTENIENQAKITTETESGISGNIQFSSKLYSEIVENFGILIEAVLVFLHIWELYQYHF